MIEVDTLGRMDECGVVYASDEVYEVGKEYGVRFKTFDGRWLERVFIFMPSDRQNHKYGWFKGVGSLQPDEIVLYKLIDKM